MNEAIASGRWVRPGLVAACLALAEVVQEVTVRTDGAPVCLCGGSTVFIGPDGDVRLVVRKGVTNVARRIQQVSYVQSLDRPVT